MVAMLSIKFLSFDVLEVSMMDHNLLTSPKIGKFFTRNDIQAARASSSGQSTEVESTPARPPPT